ncbi:hypothetical protein NGM37_14100, partial [Streptomyces sp. TRM76130]|nr:hypothetical protein [Streptomyces sp. TRM76130]
MTASRAGVETRLERRDEYWAPATPRTPVLPSVDDAQARVNAGCPAGLHLPLAGAVSLDGGPLPGQARNR